MLSRMKYALAGILLLASLDTLAASQLTATDFSRSIATLEKNNGGRLGVSALNIANGERLKYRANERFAMASTFKLLLVAAVLHRVDLGKETLDRSIKFTATDIESYAPITNQHLKDGQMSVSELCAAALQYSDNTATNLLLKTIDGPAGLTRYVRSLGDQVTRLDRNEPSLNDNIKGDLRDTTTPIVMLNTMRTLLAGNALSVNSKKTH